MEVIIDTSATKANTSTIGYSLLAAIEIVDDALVIGSSCGHVTIGLCDLAYA
jgi:hypothetical protein